MQWHRAVCLQALLGCPQYLHLVVLQADNLALGAGEIKFTGQVLPTAKLVSYTIDIARVIRGKLKLVIADACMSVDGREIYVAKDLRVGLFTSTENF